MFLLIIIFETFYLQVSNDTIREGDGSIHDLRLEQEGSEHLEVVEEI